jgi:hypothetical protein
MQEFVPAKLRTENQGGSVRNHGREPPIKYNGMWEDCGVEVYVDVQGSFLLIN